MNLRTATLLQLRQFYRELGKQITVGSDWRKLVKQREQIVREIRHRKQNPHNVL